MPFYYLTGAVSRADMTNGFLCTIIALLPADKLLWLLADEPANFTGVLMLARLFPDEDRELIAADNEGDAVCGRGKNSSDCFRFKTGVNPEEAPAKLLISMDLLREDLLFWGVWMSIE